MQILTPPLKGLKVSGSAALFSGLLTTVPVKWRWWPGLDRALGGVSRALGAGRQSQELQRVPGISSVSGFLRGSGVFLTGTVCGLMSPAQRTQVPGGDIQALLWGYIHPHYSERGQEHFASYFFK